LSQNSEYSNVSCPRNTDFSPAGEEWVSEHIPEDAMRWGADSVVVEHRFIGDIVRGAVARWARGRVDMPKKSSPLSNAERQARWRDRRNALIGALTGSPAQTAAAIIAELGVDRARKVAKALEQRIRHDREL
jgi:hypothetical protein